MGEMLSMHGRNDSKRKAFRREQGNPFSDDQAAMTEKKEKPWYLPRPLGRNQKIELLRREAQPFGFCFVLKGRDEEVVHLNCDYRNLKFVMDTIEMRADFVRWFPSRPVIEINARKIYGQRREKKIRRNYE